MTATATMTISAIMMISLTVEELVIRALLLNLDPEARKKYVSMKDSQVSIIQSLTDFFKFYSFFIFRPPMQQERQFST